MRPKKERIVHAPPKVLRFKPAGIPMQLLETVKLSLDEYEAIRLADLFGEDQESAAKKMGISRPTFTRLIEQARKKVADAVINCKELLIEGGNVHFRYNVFKCTNCGYTIKVSISENVEKKCPICGSSELINMAEHLGHGKCCRKRFGW